ncbi:MAG: hypothetical protein WBF79_07730 [Rhodococcus sp. (in: high G+C Gram-positive bacteria)]
MEHFIFTVSDAVDAMTDDELDGAIRALTSRQREMLVAGNVDAAWAATLDLEHCLAVRCGLPAF